MRPSLEQAFPRPAVMGVVNVTPDSFSDGGLFLRAEAAAACAYRFAEEGAAIVDVGGESTRPGSEGVPVEGGPIAYWQQIEAGGGESPIAILDRVLSLPYTLSRGTYVWPFAYDKQPDELTAYERRILGDFADDFGAGSGYLGWRAGIERDGTWSFFIAGD